MDTSVINQGKFANLPQPNHQAIGRNGSFWLPPKTVESFANDLQKIKQQAKKSPPKQNSSDPTISSKRASEGQSSKTSPTTGNPIKAKVAEMQNHKGQSFVARDSKTNANTSSQSASAIKFSTHVKSPPSAKLLPLLHAKELNPSKDKFSMRAPYSVNSSNPDADGNRRDKGKRDGGMKNALVSPMFSACTTKEASEFEIFNQSRAHAPSRILKDYLNRVIGPKISYVSNFERKIVRFAVDAPKGGKLGVRIEMSPEGLSVALICPDPDTRELISQIQRELFSNSENLRLGVFESYKDMDLHNNLAA